MLRLAVRRSLTTKNPLGAKRVMQVAAHFSTSTGKPKNDTAKSTPSVSMAEEALTIAKRAEKKADEAIAIAKRAKLSVNEVLDPSPYDAFRYILARCALPAIVHYFVKSPIFYENVNRFKRFSDVAKKAAELKALQQPSLDEQHFIDCFDKMTDELGVAVADIAILEHFESKIDDADVFGRMSAEDIMAIVNRVI